MVNWFGGVWRRGPNVMSQSGGANAGSLSLLNLPEDSQLALTDCENIYTYWGLGKRMVSALPRFAFSVKREINIQEAPPEAVEAFEKMSENLKQDDKLRRTSIYCRMYGMAGIFAAVDDDKIQPDENLTIGKLQKLRLVFNALNPLNLAGTIFCQEALSPKFQKPEKIMVSSRAAGSKRATIIQNNETVYLRFSDAAFTFTGVSIYQNMVPLIKTWVRSIISLERMGTKASSIVFKDGERGKASGIQVESAQRSAQLIQQMENSGAAVIGKDADVTFFPLTGVSEVDMIIKSLNSVIFMALDDTPAAILLDKDISNGLAEGTEEMKAIIMAVDNFRKDVVAPLYAFSDPYVMALAWTDEFINSMIKKYPNLYSDMGVHEIRQKWTDDFSFEFGNLYPQPEKSVQEMNGVILDNLKKAKELGADIADIQNEINERKIFKNDIELSEDNLMPEEGEEDGGEIPGEGGDKGDDFFSKKELNEDKKEGEPDEKEPAE